MSITALFFRSMHSEIALDKHADIIKTAMLKIAIIIPLTVQQFPSSILPRAENTPSRAQKTDVFDMLYAIRCLICFFIGTPHKKDSFVILQIHNRSGTKSPSDGLRYLHPLRICSEKVRFCQVLRRILMLFRQDIVCFILFKPRLTSLPFRCILCEM